MEPDKQTKGSSDAVIQTLKWIRKQGFKPVPLRRHSKASIDEKYADLNYLAPEDDLWHARDLGVGVVTGPKHSGPVDIDLDCPEAVFFAKHFLPKTPAVFGRLSKRSSHYEYRVEVDSLPKIAFIDPLAKSTIVEMRADGGHQTVFPGSLHEDTGELIEWEDKTFPDVPRVEISVLEFAVKKIAIATLVVRHMWAEGQRNEICKHLTGMCYYLDWTEDDVKSLISAVMEFVGDDDKTRIRTVTSTFRKGEKGGKITGSNTLRALLGEDRIVDRILEWAGNEMSALLQDYNERFAVVAIKGKFRVAETLGLEKGGPPTLFAKEDWLNFMSTDTITIEEKKVPKSRVWLASPRRRSYKGMDFVPGEEDSPSILNLWTGWAVTPAAGSCVAWKDLLFYSICGSDNDTFNWMMHWFANIVREPRNKPLTAPVIIGPQGAGKSLLLAYFGRILGPAYVTVTNEEHIYGRFNRHLTTALLLHSEEALYGGDRKHRGIIKSLITDEFRIFEQKGVDAERVHNYLRLALTSNETHAAPVENDDRRFTVIDMEGRKVKREAIPHILKEMAEGGPAALFHHLMHEFEYDPSIPRINVKNDALATLKQINFDPVAQWWLECLKSGQMLPDCLGWACMPACVEWPQVVSSPALHIAMQLKARERNSRYSPDVTTFALRLNKMVGTTLNRTQRHYRNPMLESAPREVKMLNSKQYTITNMPNLKECRLAFDHYIGQKIVWPAEEAEIEIPDHDKF